VIADAMTDATNSINHTAAFRQLFNQNSDLPVATPIAKKLVTGRVRPTEVAVDRLKLPAVLSLTLVPLLLWADTKPPPTNDVADIFARAVSAQKFAGSPVRDVMLTDAEIRKNAFRYGSEFTVVRAGKSIRCEDWFFTIERKEGHWVIAEVTRGRCND
jgi:hypothetical protein